MAAKNQVALKIFEEYQQKLSKERTLAYLSVCGGTWWGPAVIQEVSLTLQGHQFIHVQKVS